MSNATPPRLALVEAGARPTWERARRIALRVVAILSGEEGGTPAA